MAAVPHPTDSPPGAAHGVWQQEGLAQFCVGGAFFRESSQTGRDLAVLAAIAHKKHHLTPGSPFRVLDAMTGCGVRPLRYALEAGADYVWANEGNWDLNETLSGNLSRSLSSERYRITHQDANTVLFDCHQRQDFYDLIDIDSFGSPMPALASSLWAIKLGGLLYLTSTDGRATSGHAPDKSLQTYGAYARSHPAVHEQGLRLLLGAVAQQAAARNLSAWPVFSWYHGDVNRVMVRIQRSAAGPVAWQRDRYGFLAYCHHCGQFQTVLWKKLGRGVSCPCAANASSQSNAPILSGPMWLGPLHNAADLAAMQDIAKGLQKMAEAPGQPNSAGHDSGGRKQSRRQQDSQKQDGRARQWQRCQTLLAIMQAEAEMPPYFYPLAEIGRRGKMDIPARDGLIRALTDQGFRATRTHLSAQALKTDAPLATCLSLAQQVSQ